MSFDTLEIKEFYRAGFEVSQQNTEKLNSYPKKGLKKLKETFNEFFINGQPLSIQLTEFFNESEPITLNWVGALGFHFNQLMEEIKIKQLQQIDINDELITNSFPETLDKKYLKDFKKNYKTELADEKTLLYVCGECGDYACGGISTLINIDDDDFVEWIIKNDNEESTSFGQEIRFRFEYKSYFETLNNYLIELNNSANKL